MALGFNWGVFMANFLSIWKRENLKNHQILHAKSEIQHTLKPRYNELRYSEFYDIVNTTQLPFLRFTKHITFD